MAVQKDALELKFYEETRRAQSISWFPGFFIEFLAILLHYENSPLTLGLPEVLNLGYVLNRTLFLVLSKAHIVS